MTATRGLGFTAAHRVIVWVFGHRAGDRSTTAMARVAGLAQHLFLVVDIANLTKDRVAFLAHAPDFTGRQLDLRVGAVTAHQRGRSTRRTHELAAFAGGQFQIVNG